MDWSVPPSFLSREPLKLERHGNHKKFKSISRDTIAMRTRRIRRRGLSCCCVGALILVLAFWIITSAVKIHINVTVELKRTGDTIAFPLMIDSINDAASTVTEQKAAITKETAVVTTTATTMATAMNTVMSWNERAERYKYHPPIPRTLQDQQEATSICGESPSFDKFFELSYQYRSVRDEDKIIYELFFQYMLPTKFTYLEMGAFNGVRESNTRFFDECLQWEGVLIEANPLKYPKLLRTRPHAHRFNVAGSCGTDRMIDFYSVAFTNAAQVDHVPNGSILDPSKIVSIPCASLTPILRQIMPHITFFSLDVEGAEYMVLEHLDFAQLSIDLIMMESVNHFCRPGTNCTHLQQSRQLLNRAGYVGYDNILRASDLFVHPSAQSFSRRLQEGGFQPATWNSS